MNIKALTKIAGTWIKKNSPSILTGSSIVLSGTAVILGITATPKFMEAIDDREYIRYISKKEKAKLIVKHYWPTALCYLASAACSVFSHNVQARATTALSAACSLTEKAFSDYRKEVENKIGKEEETKIQKEVVEKQQGAEQKIPLHYTVVDPDDDDVLCYDMMSGSYFKSNKTKIGAAINRINELVRMDDSASLNDFYFEVGIPENGVGELLEWRVNDGYAEVSYEEHLSPSGKPALAIKLKGLLFV